MNATAGLDPAPATPSRPRRRPAPWVWVALAVVVAAGAAAAAVWARVSTTPTLQGAIVTPPVPTYDFTLHDEHGRQTRLSDFRGKAVALTFLYTHCPDACPLTAERMHESYQRLGVAAKRIAFLAVSVDPNGDTPEAVRAFLTAHHAEGELHYLTGTYPELKRVWAYYYVTSDARATPAKATASAPASPGLVGHSAMVLVIDPSGNMRVILPANFESQDLTTDLKVLLGERAR